MITINLTAQESAMYNALMQNNFKDSGPISVANLRPAIQSYLADRDNRLCYCSLKNNTFSVRYWDSDLELLKVLEHGK